MVDYQPVNPNGTVPFTSTASATITGGQLLDASGNGTVAPAAAGSSAVVGVAAHDAASGAKLTVWPITGVVHESVVSAAITFANNIISAASGQVNTGAAAAGTRLGVALTTQASVGQKVRWIGGL